MKVGVEATGGLEWRLWQRLEQADIAAVPLPPAQIKAFARSRGTHAKTERIDAEFIAAFMAFRPEAGRELPDETIVALRSYTTKHAQLVEIKQRLRAQSSARRKQDAPAAIKTLDQELIVAIEARIRDIESGSEG
ncbi:IS110 family transposase [Falsigemmobacter faecalis]|uniref:IS110 family transposase n=1 Tax=Falsigemmobacter faecalis TaxID=2488730 RepID=UPI00227742B8|nr:transposase [Falsigemmobacter faecalis]